LNYLYKVSKNTPILNYMKICPVGVEFFLVEGRTGTVGQTDMMKLIVALGNFAKALKIFHNRSELME
jgi:hypothetical protein